MTTKLQLVVNGELDQRELAVQTLTLTSNGVVTVLATTSTVVQPVPDPVPVPTPDPEPDPVTPPPQTGCGPVPANVRIHKTGQLNFSDSVPNNQTSANMIHSFEFNSGSGGRGRVVATRMTAGEGKLVVVTKCPGDINNPVEGKSSQYSSESTTVWYSTDKNDSRRTYCILEPNTTYYANVLNRSGQMGEPPTCTGNCGFYFQKG